MKEKTKKKLKIAVVVYAAFMGLMAIAKMKKSNSIYDDELEQKNPMEGKMVQFIEDENDSENADGVKGHLIEIDGQAKERNFYDKYVKRCIDIVFSFGGLVLLSPIYVVIALAIKIDDPGPVLFTQKRVGQNKQYFKLHKFRSMKMSTPHDIPTHMLEDPEQYITKVGKFLRKSSLDELPQIWDIFIGNMSIIGPRPALWNQDCLTSFRDQYGANNVKPGLTGWAQINGRDELNLSVKAQLDGEYVDKQSLLFDIKCFLGTIKSVIKSDGIIEGGTGELNKDYEEKVGFQEEITLDINQKKKILITGANSYIGTFFEEYAKKNYKDNFIIDTLDMMDESWKNYSFSRYDTVLHVAGIAHADVGNVSEKTKQKYYRVNRDLAIETAKKAKNEGVKQFIYMSSIIIYGESAPYGNKKVITKYTKPKPANFYGDSKWQGDQGVRELGDDKFNVVVVRPPMIYGKNSKGNYPALSKLAKKLPVFPNINNERSMLHIDNLCEFLCKVILIGKGGIFFPQNKEYTKTVDMVKEISYVSNKKIKITVLFNPIVFLLSKMPGKVSRLVNKAFGSLIYDQSLSSYKYIDYQVVNLKESIKKTEFKNSRNKKNKVLILVNHNVVIYNFRRELVERLISDGYEVYLSCPQGDRIIELVSMGCHFIKTDFDRHGINVIKEMKLLYFYKKIMKEIKPDVVLSYTIKPNIYGGIAASSLKIPYLANITGLGTAVEHDSLLQKIIILMYKCAFKNINTVFVQNIENKQFFIDNNISKDKLYLLPGSGVNLEQFHILDYPESTVEFAFISRIMKEKGIDHYLEMAEYIKERYPEVKFHICGFCEEEYEDILHEYEEKGIVEYHGMISDVREVIKYCSAIIHPTYYPEGLSNVLLESCACGRPIITTDRSGCREVVDEGVNGYLVKPNDTKTLINAVEKIIELSLDEKKNMGLSGRKKVEQEFNRQIVVDAYMEKINIIMRGN